MAMHRLDPCIPIAVWFSIVWTWMLPSLFILSVLSLVGILWVSDYLVSVRNVHVTCTRLSLGYVLEVQCVVYWVCVFAILLSLSKLSFRIISPTC